MPGSHLIKTIEENPLASFRVAQGINWHINKNCHAPIRVLYERITEGKKRNWKPVAVFCPDCNAIAWLDQAALVRNY